MNCDTATTEVSNKFSWRRAWAISSLYEPTIKWQLIIYAIVSAFTGGVVYTLNATVLGILSMGLFGTVTNLMLYFGPLVFARKSNPVVETTLPATNAEKCTFYILYSLVVIPLVLNIPYYIVLLTGNLIHPVAETFQEILSLQSSMITKSYGLSILSFAMPISVCLYTLMASEKNRIVKAVLWTIGVNVAIGLIGGIYGVVMALTGPQIDPEDASAAYHLGEILGSGFNTLIILSSLASAAVSAVMIWLTCRKISYRQL